MAWAVGTRTGCFSQGYLPHYICTSISLNTHKRRHTADTHGRVAASLSLGTAGIQEWIKAWCSVPSHTDHNLDTTFSSSPFQLSHQPSLEEKLNKTPPKINNTRFLSPSPRVPSPAGGLSQRKYKGLVGVYAHTRGCMCACTNTRTTCVTTFNHLNLYSCMMLLIITRSGMCNIIT